MRRIVATPLLVLVPLLSAGAASAQPPPCRAQIDVAPARPYVGQEILWRLRITHPGGTSPTLDSPPSFPDFRAEWLPSREPDESGGGFPVLEERRALFPALAGRLELPAVEIQCRSPEGGSRVTVASRSIEVRAAPEAERPADWKGLVGPVRLSVLVTPETVTVGEALRVSVEIEGAANVWDAASPLTHVAGSTRAEVFPHPPELARDVGEQLVLRRYFAYDVVPRRPGRLWIPELRVPWLDPERGRFRVARAGPYSARVLPEPSAQERSETPPAPPAVLPGLGKRSPAPGPAAAAWRWLGAAAALGLLAGACGALFLVRRRRGAAAGRGLPLARALRAARAAEAQGDVAGAAAVVARGIRSALSGVRPEAAALSAEELFAASHDAAARDLARLLARAEHLRFAPEAGAADLCALLAAVEALAAPGAGDASR